MKKLYLIRPEWPEVPGFDFKIDIEFETKEAAEEYCKENSITHYYIEETIPNRELFFIDIMARIPYGVKFRFELDKGVYKTVSVTNAKDLPHLDILYSYWMGRGYFLPYLRPISSMTKEEWGEFEKKFEVPLGAGESATYFKVYDYVVIDFGCHYDMMLSDMADMLSWLYLHHFDINNLIEKGLALEAPEGMYKTE